MKKEILDKWIINLRSGEYPQTTGKLVRTDEGGRESFCCLGVLCISAELERVEDPLKIFRNPLGVSTVSDSLGSGMREFLGMDYSTHENFIVMNDCAMMNFSQIADWIEKNKEKLLVEGERAREPSEEEGDAE